MLNGLPFEIKELGDNDVFSKKALGVAEDKSALLAW